MPAGPSIGSSRNQRKENALPAPSKAHAQPTAVSLRKNKQNKSIGMQSSAFLFKRIFSKTVMP
jgi:hypothetical protein